MQTDSQANNTVDTSTATAQTTSQTPNTEGAMDYNHSPHKGIDPKAVVGETQQPDNKQLVFGKFENIDKASEAYKNAENKIREQGTELTNLKKQVQDYTPMEDYSADTWNNKVSQWKESGILPKEITGDASIPEVDMLLAGMKQAGLSEKQAQLLFKGAVEREANLVQEKKAEVQEKLGAEGMKKVQDLSQFAMKLSPTDAAIFESLFTFPYVESEQVDLMHRLLVGKSEKPIPASASATPAMKSSTDIYKELMLFQNEHKESISTNVGLQQKYKNLWQSYEEAKKKGF